MTILFSATMPQRERLLANVQSRTGYQIYLQMRPSLCSSTPINTLSRLVPVRCGCLSVHAPSCSKDVLSSNFVVAGPPYCGTTKIEW
ncbi:hypothetical protein FA13DRAFT_1728776 [Coprinellus micaceus]|uniref:Uncharacterized protein n=1 Tax=Coprinellus micaceus TaxID=71717 RepID=A0A4Y7TLB6_COPMI|nr:hypothetical protein FA13DRAFT_1728776 [Coprinellus micaceus]